MSIVYHPKRFNYGIPTDYADAMREAIRHFYRHCNRLPDLIAVPLERLEDAHLAMAQINGELKREIPVEASIGGVLSNEIWPGQKND